MQVRIARSAFDQLYDSASMVNDSAIIWNQGMISEQDVQAYKRDGIIVVPDVLGADTLSQMRSVIAELVDRKSVV